MRIQGSLRQHFNFNGTAKARYRTRREALEWLIRHGLHNRNSPYKCPHCREWHVGRNGAS
jgi:hypothetical protein